MHSKSKLSIFDSQPTRIKSVKRGLHEWLKYLSLPPPYYCKVKRNLKHTYCMVKLGNCPFPEIVVFVSLNWWLKPASYVLAFISFSISTCVAHLLTIQLLPLSQNIEWEDEWEWRARLNQSFSYADQYRINVYRLETSLWWLQGSWYCYHTVLLSAP